MNTLLKEAYSADAFRQQGHALVDLLADHLATAEAGTGPVLNYQLPEEQLAYWQADFAQPTNIDPIPLLATMLQRSIHLHHPQCMGHQVSPPLPLAALTGLMTGLLNQGMAVYEMGMTANALERIVIQWLAEQLTLGNEAGGLLTSGGTLANLTALLTARAVRAPADVWEEGTTSRLAIMVSEEAHYCVDRAARIMGLGTEGIIRIPTNDRFQMRTDLLEMYYERARVEGLVVFAVVGSCCSTSTGSYDDRHCRLLRKTHALVPRRWCPRCRSGSFRNLPASCSGYRAGRFGGGRLSQNDDGTGTGDGGAVSVRCRFVPDLSAESAVFMGRCRSKRLVQLR
jgi:L-2,4-diaminobutyrate decarboxylase